MCLHSLDYAKLHVLETFTTFLLFSEIFTHLKAHYKENINISMDSTQNFEDYYDSSDEKWVRRHFNFNFAFFDFFSFSVLVRFYGILYDLNSIHKIQLHLTIDKKRPGPDTTLIQLLTCRRLRSDKLRVSFSSQAYIRGRADVPMWSFTS